MQSEIPPSIDPVAARRWSERAPDASPWLHEEVARRMEPRLEWIVAKPEQWVDWEPSLGGLESHAALTRRYPQATSYVLEQSPSRRTATHRALRASWWNPSQWGRKQVHLERPSKPVKMVWANMSLHLAADPFALMREWFELLEVDGFLMFSCLGPDTLRELRGIYAEQGWPAPTHEFTDMHDWGDMLVQAGFAEPVMDMERITLSYSSPSKLLDELRGLGRNLNRHRHPGLRGKRWHAELQNLMQERLARPSEGGRLTTTFEVIYGHAFKPAPRLKVQANSSISLEQMRAELGLNRSQKGQA